MKPGNHFCQIGRIFDADHPTCKTCRIWCALKSVTAPTLEEIGKKHGLKPVYPKEEKEQEDLARFLDFKFPGEWFHVPNEGKKAIGYHMKMKLQGLKSGVPDNFIMRPVRGCPGVVIELKRVKGGNVSPEQKTWLETLKSFGWITRVSKGADDAIRFVMEVYGI